MLASKQQKFAELVSYLYENKNSSPIFVRKASNDFAVGKYENAVETLRKGLKVYPDSPVAYFVLGRILARLGFYDQALKSVKRGSEILCNGSSFDFYAREILELKEKNFDKATLISPKADNPIISEQVRLESEKVKEETLTQSAPIFEAKREEPPVPKTSTLSLLIGGQADAGSDEIDFATSANETGEGDIPELAKQTVKQDIDKQLLGMTSEISRAKNLFSESLSSIDRADDVASLLGDDRNFASETLAEIYVNRGDYNKAIDIYQLLLRRDPQFKNYFEKKIFEIKTYLGSR